MTENALVVAQGTAMMPAMNMAQATHRRNEMVQFVQKIMVPNVDYGKVPGTEKDTLFKPGAEKLTTFFGLSPRFEIIREIEQWNGDEPMFYYLIRCRLYRGDVFVGEADASCNSRESRYRFRWVQEGDIPQGTDVSKLRRRGGKVSEFTFAIDKAETGGKYGKPTEYWQAFTDAIDGGTARKFKKATSKGKQYDAYEIDMAMYRVPNEDIFSQVNTILKMAEKRALVAATLVTVNASEFFTQDLEDLDIIDVPHTVARAPQPAAPKPPTKPKDAPAVIHELFDDYDQPTGDPFLNGDTGHKAAAAEAQREIAALEPHWMDRVDKNLAPIRPQFWQWVKAKMALTEADAYKALEVEHIHDYTGTLKEAMDQIEEWAAEQSGQKPKITDEYHWPEGRHWTNDPEQYAQWITALEDSHITTEYALGRLGVDSTSKDTHANVTAALLEIGIKV